MRWSAAGRLRRRGCRGEEGGGRWDGGTHGCCSGTAEARAPVETFAARDAPLLRERARPVAAREVRTEALAIIVKVGGVGAKACGARVVVVERRFSRCHGCCKHVSNEDPDRLATKALTRFPFLSSSSIS